MASMRSKATRIRPNKWSEKSSCSRTPLITLHTKLTSLGMKTYAWDRFLTVREKNANKNIHEWKTKLTSLIEDLVNNKTALLNAGLIEVDLHQDMPGRWTQITSLIKKNKDSRKQSNSMVQRSSTISMTSQIRMTPRLRLTVSRWSRKTSTSALSLSTGGRRTITLKEPRSSSHRRTLICLRPTATKKDRPATKSRTSIRSSARVQPTTWCSTRALLPGELNEPKDQCLKLNSKLLTPMNSQLPAWRLTHAIFLSKFTRQRMQLCHPKNKRKKTPRRQLKNFRETFRTSWSRRNKLRVTSGASVTTARAENSFRNVPRSNAPWRLATNRFTS